MVVTHYVVVGIELMTSRKVAILSIFKLFLQSFYFQISLVRDVIYYVSYRKFQDTGIGKNLYSSFSHSQCHRQKMPRDPQWTWLLSCGQEMDGEARSDHFLGKTSDSIKSSPFILISNLKLVLVLLLLYFLTCFTVKCKK